MPKMTIEFDVLTRNPVGLLVESLIKSDDYLNGYDSGELYLDGEFIGSYQIAEED